MALMDLLTMGRSLSAVRDNRHRYKMKSGQLPTFGNPEGPVLEKRFAVGAAAKPARDKNTNEVKRMKTEAAMEENEPNATPAGRWMLKANPFKSKRAAEPREAIQAELSLDKVRPVRNDLSGSDLELRNVQLTARETNSEKVEKLEKVEPEEIP